MKFQAVCWSPERERILAPACRGDLPFIRADLQSGKAVLYHCKGPVTDGYVVLRPEGSELVIVLGVGKGCGPVITELKKIAKLNGFKSLRTHIVDSRLKALYERKGFEFREYIVGCEL